MKLITKILILIVASAAYSADSAPVWSESEKTILETLHIEQLSSQPSSPSNQYAYSSEAVKFGKRIFFDKRFSMDGSLSCASCHQEEKAFTDGRKVAHGINKTARNTQTILGTAYATWFYWDGRKDSLWSQALVPFEAADEMASSRVKVLRIIGNDATYRQYYEKLFGQFPDSIYNNKIKSNSGPWGDWQSRDNWFRLSSHTKKTINKAFANIGKAIAAYERALELPETQFDRFVKTLLSNETLKANTLISDDAQQGLKLFLNESKTHCLRCHNGPLFSNNDFHNIGSGNFSGSNLDFGRYLGIQSVIQDEFNCLGDYSDAEASDCAPIRFLPKQLHTELQGAFKTPSLRYLNKTKPYFHDGRFNTLNEVLNHYRTREKSSSELPELKLSDQELEQLIAFLNVLNQ